MFYFASRLISLLGAFLYPAYASYRTLSRRPAEEPELERWLMYWSVLGVFLSAEYVGEWLVSWIPFYWVAKTLFLLYLALPQTQGATVLYQSRLAPLLHQHEGEIDTALASLKTQFYSFLQAKLKLLWDHVSSAVLAQASDPASALNNNPAVPVQPDGGVAGHPPTLADPVSGAAQMAWGMWQTYGPAIIAKVSAAATAPPPASAGTRGIETEGYDAGNLNSASPAFPMPTPFIPASIPIPSTMHSGPSSAGSGSGGSKISASASAASVYLDAGGTGGEGRYEQIDKDDVGSNASGSEEGQRPSGWFGGWGAGGKEYEKVSLKEE